MHDPICYGCIDNIASMKGVKVCETLDELYKKIGC